MFLVCGRKFCGDYLLYTWIIYQVDVAVSSAALQSLVRSNSSSTDNSSWEVGWMLAPLDNSSSQSELNSLQKEVNSSSF